MAKSKNKVNILGNVGRDAETRFTGSGNAVTNFSVATSRSWKDKQSDQWKEDTEWHNVTMWGNDRLAPYIKKGVRVDVEGRLHTRSYEGKDGVKRYSTEIIADQVIVLDKSASDDEDTGGKAPGKSDAGSDNWSASDDDIPF